MHSASPLTPPPISHKTLHRAQAAFVEYYGRCFWSMNPRLTVNEENRPRIIDGLRRSGDRRAWQLAEELCR